MGAPELQFVDASVLAAAYDREESPAAKDAIAQILINSRMCAEGHRPICQDTGIALVFLKVGMDVRFEGFAGTLDDAVTHHAVAGGSCLDARRLEPRELLGRGADDGRVGGLSQGCLRRWRRSRWQAACYPPAVS